MALDKIKGAVAQAEDDAGRDGNLYLQAFAMIMMMCGIAIWEIAKKILAYCTARSEAPAIEEEEVQQRCEEPRVATMRLRRPRTCQAAGSATPRQEPERAEEPRRSGVGRDLHRGEYHGGEQQLQQELPHHGGVQPEVRDQRGDHCACF